MTDWNNSASSKYSFTAIAGGISGVLLSRYVGAAVWIPALSAIALLLIFTKTSFGPKNYRVAIAVACGHILWFFSAGVLTKTWAPIILDIVILLVPVVWLLARPTPKAVYFLGIVELLALGLNLYGLISAPIGSLPHRALLVHVVLRAVVLASLVKDHRSARQQLSVVQPEVY